jgi:hypothetical protein
MVRDLDLPLAKLRVGIAEATAIQADIARKAFRLLAITDMRPIGDCFAYAAGERNVSPHCCSKAMILSARI